MEKIAIIIDVAIPGYRIIDKEKKKTKKYQNLKRKTSRHISVKKKFLKNFVIFKGKHMSLSLSFDKVACLKPAIY